MGLLISAPDLPGVNDGTVAWGDYDRDGDLDILLTGQDSDGNYLPEFTATTAGTLEASLTSMPPCRECYQSSGEWGDYDNDGDLDILLTGTGGEGVGYDDVSRVYRNDGHGVFTDIGAGLPGVDSGGAVWGDYDNDGDLDILLVGYAGGTSYVAIIYRNDGGGVFEPVSVSPAGLTGVEDCVPDWGDYDNDGDLDILLVGYSQSGGFSEYFTLIYRNEGPGPDPDGWQFQDIDANLRGLVLTLRSPGATTTMMATSISC